MNTSRLIRIRAVVERTGLSRASVYRLAAAGVFPSPVKLGERASAWSEQEVSTWIESRLAERDQRDAAA